MTATRRRRRAIKDNPLDGEQLLLDALYGRPKPLVAVPDPVPANENGNGNGNGNGHGHGHGHGNGNGNGSQVEIAGPGVAAPPPRAARSRRPKPDHYRVISISLYVEDIERLEGLVSELKRRGHYKANKSQLIRQALAQVDLDQVMNEA